MSSFNKPPASAPQATALLDVLLRIRKDMEEKSMGPYLYIGTADTDRVITFAAGYARCSSRLGVQVGKDALFWDWLEVLRNPQPGRAWDGRFLEACGGDHERAVRMYLDHVAQFRAFTPEELAAIPYHGEGEHPWRAEADMRPTCPPVFTLDVLLEVRQIIGEIEGRLAMFIGDIKVQRMAGYIDGYRLCLELMGLKDEEYDRFEEWLRRQKDLPPGQTWEQPLLRACRGDHEKAIRSLLDAAAEFRQSGPVESP